MEKDILDYVRACNSCCQRTNYGQTKAPLGDIFNEPQVPFEVIATDIVGPLPVSESGNRYILSIMDHFSRYCEFIALPDQKAEQVARALVHRVITKFGVPKVLLSDQGANFTSDLIRQMCCLLRVRKVQTTGFHPQSNGRLERVHSTIAKMLSHFVDRNQTDWDEYLPYVTMAYNSQWHESTGFSPYEMVFGRKMECPLEADLTITEESEIYGDHVESLRAKLKATHELAERRKAVAKRKNKRQYDKKAKSCTYEVGQWVYLHVPSLKRHRTKKLTRLWRGPYRIVEVLSPLNVVLIVRKRRVVVHVNRIKPCPGRTVVPSQLAEVQDDDGLDEDVTAQGDEVDEPEPLDQEESEEVVVPASAAPGPNVNSRPKRQRQTPKHLVGFELS